MKDKFWLGIARVCVVVCVVLAACLGVWIGQLTVSSEMSQQQLALEKHLKEEDKKHQQLHALGLPHGLVVPPRSQKR